MKYNMRDYFLIYKYYLVILIMIKMMKLLDKFLFINNYLHILMFKFMSIN